ncbi:subtilisin-like serine protease QhpE [Pseudomonas sp. TUM22785]|uniref:subtilisin-like serine protease QhpE n=1 Tax=Pseudomonas sp. TUM22785 TaxID=3019098 RepID=UPI0023057B20|nr:peptidase S8 and S53 subtilisin kexin sedolisin [Pseudomonas sp. TUM22785]WCD82795.1 peptidase S8 and S53 subtilisin kexin sedolisin [Pseudomonas sp. TUM22785]
MATEPSIGIIDSGFAPKQAARVALARRFWLEGGELQEGEAQPDILGHGSLVLDTFGRHGGPARVCMAQVFGERWQTSPLQVAAALYWLLEQDVALITMSLGLRNDRPVLREACVLAQSAGVLLCASSPAQGAPVYPAGYPGVIRITGDARCAPGQWSWLNSPQADFGAPVSAANGAAGASMACAALSGIISAHLREHPGASREAVLNWLHEGAAFTGPERRHG